ncbi:LacI family DNA-binding transcriptional regulator [Enterococcus mundtii]|uniref:LacI family DNA-binding transcriptional regulator n=1 Tax=Enterococcus TaxID=1350 RepID=UPI00044749A0|nr:MULTISPECIES: LacI family DNA-binding transcriptional regulator [Enterococcus]AZP92024.1 LacI family transcriptional regulator [Enterococcus mundtii]EYT94774.1 LacI family transcription regulator [Enterococcus mundtii CRL35]MDA9427743.1 Maltose operon transcriptional repressor MalR, LacI family [Enterococcus mundtii 1A]MDK4212246.1 LacI family DNA-binding transcriptional regulator [Enterococcus mundtii]MDO7879293.1 LacI family DNA-binding transcriptional regulator [Enterococcus mundtii]
MAITVKDVAKKAGVATSTVSRVINDHPSISETTKKKVRKIMDELGYVPNITARNLGKRVSSAVGVILPPLDSKERLGNPFYLEIMEAINEEARHHGVTTAIATAKSFDVLLENVQRMHLQKQVDGFILVYSDSDDPVIDYLYEQQIPFTLIGQPYHHENEIIYIDNDNQLLGKQATEFLIDNGHKNILFVTNTTHESLYFERYFGYQKAMMLAGLSAQPSVTLEQAEDYLDFDTILKKAEATALVVIDDIFALRTMQLAQMYGYIIPETLSMISFNNSIFSTLMHPYLTSIDIDISELGRVAMQKLQELIHEEVSNGVRLVIPHRLIKRETVVPLKEK